MKNNNFVLKGNLCYSKDQDTIVSLENHYVVCVDGISKGVFRELPEEYNHLKLLDYTNHLILPGLVDLHTHAPQYTFRGIGMDAELLEWLEQRAFPEEAKYQDINYARNAYSILGEDIRKSATTRACIFATIHVDGTLQLMDILEETGVKCFVGKVNMDRNAPSYILEESAEQSIKNTQKWLEQCVGRYQNIKPIITPRFIPSCTDSLLKGLKEICTEYGLPVQSHLSENEEEIAWVKELCPQSEFYGQAYEQAGLFGKEQKTIMAHCVVPCEAEIESIKENGVYIAHCPSSNMNLSSGIAPIRKCLEKGISVGLGSDVAGGSVLSIFKAMTEAIQVSKLRWKLADQTYQPITIEQAFYMGTKGGGSFFGNVGSFEAGYELDAIVWDESNLPYVSPFTVRERLERLMYLSDNRNIMHKFVSGEIIF